MSCPTCGIAFTFKTYLRRPRKFCSHRCSLVRRATFLPDEDRFWSRVTKGSDTECWIWSAGCEGQGYGCFPCNGRNWKAHRYAWELKNGPIPRGKCVLHRCDNPPCVNEKHLFLGTKKMNTQDMIAKGRGGWKNGTEWQSTHAGKSPKGELNRHAKLTYTDVVAIRQLAALLGPTTRIVALQYKLHPDTVRAIVKRKLWSHLP